jgi:hypothetical protein
LSGGRVWPGSSQLLRLSHKLVQDGDQVGGRLAGTCSNGEKTSLKT